MAAPSKRPLSWSRSHARCRTSVEVQKELMPTRVTTHAGEAVLQDPTSEELLNHLADDLAPVAPAPREPLILTHGEACEVDRAELFKVILNEAIQR